jgi:hypothetical protein
MISSDEKAPQLYCFVDRDDAKLARFFLPKAIGVLVAEADFLRAIELPLWLDYPMRWTMLDTNWGQSHDGKLEVAKLGEYWFIGRRGRNQITVSETVVEAFVQVPIGTPTCCDAMLVAEHCRSEVVNLPVGAHWIKHAKTERPAIVYGERRMGVDVGGESFDHSGWCRVLNLAIENGWQPTGTAPPDYGRLQEDAPVQDSSGSWDGNYSSNDFQEVTDRDACALGEALRRGVAALEAQEREKPTRWPDDWLRRVCRFADRALKGGFLIG